MKKKINNSRPFNPRPSTVPVFPVIKPPPPQQIFTNPIVEFIKPSPVPVIEPIKPVPTFSTNPIIEKTIFTPIMEIITPIVSQVATVTQPIQTITTQPKPKTKPFSIFRPTSIRPTSNSITPSPTLVKATPTIQTKSNIKGKKSVTFRTSPTPSSTPSSSSSQSSKGIDAFSPLDDNTIYYVIGGLGLLSVFYVIKSK